MKPAFAKPPAPKPVGLQVACLLLGLLALVLAGVAWSAHAENETLSQRLASAQQELDEQQTIARDARRDVEALKNLLGYGFEEVGEPDSFDDRTVIGHARQDIRRHAGPLTQETMRNALLELSRRLREQSARR